MEGTGKRGIRGNGIPTPDLPWRRDARRGSGGQMVAREIVVARAVKKELQGSE